jgi:hypothetical protein
VADTLVCIESGSRRVFAAALEWPGWCRSARTEDEALEVLAGYASRYAPVTARAGVGLPSRAAEGFEVVERLVGNTTTDFGAPAIAAEYERRALDAKGARRLAALVAACWQVFDGVVASAPAALRKGPRGGGRDRDETASHVADAEIVYARKLGIRLGDNLPETRAALIDLLGTRSDGRSPGEKGWPPRYAARRIAWHVLDHAWEIEDKSG